MKSGATLDVHGMTQGLAYSRCPANSPSLVMGMLVAVVVFPPRLACPLPVSGSGCPCPSVFSTLRAPSFQALFLPRSFFCHQCFCALPCRKPQQLMPGALRPGSSSGIISGCQGPWGAKSS